MSNGALPTDYILNIPLTTIIKCHFSCSEPGYKDKYHNILTQFSMPLTMGLVAYWTPVQGFKFWQQHVAACENVTSDLGLADGFHQVCTPVFSGHHLQLASEYGRKSD